MIAAVDATKSGTLAADAFKWRTRGFLPSFASPVMDDERLYTVDNSAIVGAFDLKTGARLWEKSLGTLQKGSPLLADGKLYVGTENGKFYILRPSATGVEVLDEDLLGTEQTPEPIIASPIVADGRVYVTSMDATYAIGKRAPRKPARSCTSATGAPVAQWCTSSRSGVSVRIDHLARANRHAQGAVVRCEGQLHSRRARGAVVGRSVERRGGCEGRLHRGGAGIDRGIS